MGETEALAKTASKGAGLPWGLAEEASFAVSWLEQRNQPGVEVLARYLQSIGQPNDYRAKFCPIGSGSWISDSGSWSGSFPLEVRQPLLLVPFIAQTLTKNSLLLTWLKNKILISRDHVQIIECSVLVDGQLHRCDMCMQDEIVKPGQKSDRVADAREEWFDILLGFAQHTYAPASEISRLMGAGAGLNDND